MSGPCYHAVYRSRQEAMTDIFSTRLKSPFYSILLLHESHLVIHLLASLPQAWLSYNNS